MCVIDQNGGLWSYGGDGKLRFDPSGSIEARSLPLPASRKAIEIKSGRYNIQFYWLDELLMKPF